MEGKKNTKKTVLIAAIALLLIAALAFILPKFLKKDDPEPTPPVDPIPEVIEVSGLSFAKTGYQVGVGKTVETSVTIVPDDAEDKTLTFSSEDSSIATVDANGVVAGVKEGTTKITAKSTNGCTAEATVEVVETVWIAMPQEYYAWNKAVAGSGHSDGWVCKPILDESIKDWKVTFKTGDKNVAKVDEKGNVVCYEMGSTELTATVSDGTTSYSASMPIYVNGYVVDITNVDFSHEGGGHYSVPTFFYGCHCETNGEENVIATQGKITKYYNGSVKKYSFDDKNAPKMKVSMNTSYYEYSGKGYVKLLSKAAEVTATKALNIAYYVDDNSGLQTICKGAAARIEPTGFTATSGGANVFDLMYMFPDEFNVFVKQNNKAATVNFSAKVADIYLSVPSATDEIDPITSKDNTATFTAKKASGTPLDTDVNVYSEGGQMVTLHVFLADMGSPVSFVGGDTLRLKYGESFSAVPTIDKTLADAYGGVTVSYKTDNSGIAKVSSTGIAEYVAAGDTTLTVTAKYAGKTESKTYKVYCNGYKLSLSLASNNVLYYDGPVCKFTLSLVQVTDGKGVGQGSVTPSGMKVDVDGKNYLHHRNGNEIYVLEAPDKYVAEKCRFRYVSPSGEEIYTEWFEITAEPTLDRPACNSYNIGWNTNYYCFDLDPYGIKAKCKIASVTIRKGADVVKSSEIKGDGYEFWWTQNGNFTSPSQEVVFRLTTLGGQTYDATFVPELKN